MQPGAKEPGAPEQPDAATAGDVPEPTGKPIIPRGHWKNRVEFVLSCIGLCVGIGNVWRFPSRCFENGGGAFLLPYIFLLFVVGGPLLLLETGMGQFQQLGPTAVAQYVQGVKGMPLSYTVIAFTIGVYYNSVMSTALLYLVLSCNTELPWSKCDKSWGAESNCRVMNKLSNITNITSVESASSQYYRIHILGGDEEPIKTFGDIGTLQIYLFLASSASWVVVYLCICNGIKTSGKMVYFSATVPYFLMIVLFFGNIIQTGALKGITYLFIPKWKDILDGNVWRNAIEQMFFSLSIGWAGLIMFGSYNKFQYRQLVKDVVFITFLDTLTSLLGGIIVFSVLGSWATKLGRPVPEVVSKGTGLAFKVYPEAVQSLPFPPFWSATFFLLLYLLGLDSEFALMETACTYIYDVYPRTRRYKWGVAFIVCFTGFLMSIPLSFSKGGEILELMDFFGSMPLLFFALFEDLFICAVYGVDNFLNDIEFMIGSKVRVFWKITTAYITPIVLVGALIGSWSNFAPLKQTDGSEFPVWANLMGWGIAVGSILILIVGLIWAAVKIRKAGQSLKELLKKVPDFGPGDPTFSAAYKAFQEQPLEGRKDYLRLVTRRSRSLRPSEIAEVENV